MWDVRYNMIRRLLLVVGIIVSLSSCGGDIAYRIEGKLTNLEDQTLYAVFENEDIKVVDTVTCGIFDRKETGGFPGSDDFLCR